MKAKVIVGFTGHSGRTHLKGSTVDYGEAYITKLVELGKVEAVGDQTKASKAKSTAGKASKNNARKNLLSRRGRR